MFLASAAKPIDEHLKSLVDKIEAQSSSLSVLAARQFRYRLYQTPIEVTIQEARNVNLLEEFIIRAGIEFDTPLTADELASVLGLNSVFIKSTIATLQSLQVIGNTSEITVTPEGRLFYERGSVPQPPYTVKIYAFKSPLEENIIFKYEPLDLLDDALITLPNLADFVNVEQENNDLISLSLDELKRTIQASSLGLHIPEDGKIINSCKIISPGQKIWRKTEVLVIYDANDDQLNIQVRNSNKILESVTNNLQSLIADEKISLKSLCFLSDDIINFEREATLKRKNTEIEARVEKIKQKALAYKTETDSNTNKLIENGTAIQLRDRQINQAFWEVLKAAKRQIIIYSPWVSSVVVDEQFLKLLQELVNRGVWILIGYGIARRQEDEDRPMPPEVEAKLQAIRTPDGLPGVNIFWLGDSHIKEIIVDQEIHLCGSHNWLSYRGDYLPRGESVYKVTIPNQVKEAYEFLSHRFQNHAQKLWQQAIRTRNLKMAINSLCIWASLELEDVANQEIQNANCLELLPIMEKIKFQEKRRNTI
ncbi:hypothetical protein [Nostoc sp. FACHB-280]|uniref:hypothetical protein n=1 Tax=Nostoc sp. FACHB-280 TaxID=2692839 RepID=UPI00168BD563|nr:hypothetical protein [Nostoc sp. FACHB-280]MBD2493677.1 hypothetical protein [Nostoc sp. FACHB-280]